MTTDDERLAAFDAICQDLATRMTTIPAELAALRAAGQIKTVHYRELFAQKLLTDQMADLFRHHGVTLTPVSTP